MALGALDPEDGQAPIGGNLLSHTALKRPARLTEIVSAVLFLADPENTYTTGHIVNVDGGFAAAEAVVLKAWGERITADAEPARDAKTAVQEWAQSRALSPPRYEEVERSGPAHAPHFVMRVTLNGFEPEVGAASSKRAAEQAAAQAFLDRWAAS